MAGRGRGRGRNVSFNVEALGFSRGEALPGPILQPQPLFPTRDFKPVPLLVGEDYDYMVALKQEFRGTVKKSPFYLKPMEKTKDIERYSDKYQQTHDSCLSEQWLPDWKRLPAELKPKEKKTRKVKSAVTPNVVKRKKTAKDSTEIEKTLEVLEKKESEDKDEDEDQQDEEEAGGKEKEEGNEEEEEEIFDEDELEEETDYIQSYFDNGEGYGDDDDDVDEGPVY